MIHAALKCELENFGSQASTIFSFYIARNSVKIDKFEPCKDIYNLQGAAAWKNQ